MHNMIAVISVRLTCGQVYRCGNTKSRSVVCVYIWCATPFQARPVQIQARPVQNPARQVQIQASSNFGQASSNSGQTSSNSGQAMQFKWLCQSLLWLIPFSINQSDSAMVSNNGIVLIDTSLYQSNGTYMPLYGHIYMDILILFSLCLNRHLPLELICTLVKSLCRWRKFETVWPHSTVFYDMYYICLHPR